MGGFFDLGWEIGWVLWEEFVWIQDRFVWFFVVTKFMAMQVYMLLYGLYLDGCVHDDCS